MILDHGAGSLHEKRRPRGLVVHAGDRVAVPVDTSRIMRQSVHFLQGTQATVRRDEHRRALCAIRGAQASG